MKGEDIKLYSHNEIALNKLITSLEENPLAFIEHATGTGKSMIILKYLYLFMKNKRILFVSLHDEMFGQLFESQMPSLGFSKDEFYKFDTMIYHNMPKCDPEKLIEEYDCFIFDEAHHCGAKKWGEPILKLKDLVKKNPGKQMIGMTATGTRYLDDYLDVSLKYFDGKTVSRLNVGRAILSNLLPAPLYINSVNKCVDKINYIRTLLTKVPKVEEESILREKIDDINRKIIVDSDIKSLLKKYDVKPGEKYIVFCKNIEDLKQKMEEAKYWFDYEVEMFQAHSSQKKSKNIEEIKNFSKKREKISLMFAVDIFNEGFHIKDVDGVLLFRKTKSPIVYFQQIGRALSLSLRKKQIKIFDFVDNISENDVIHQLYKEIIEESKIMIKEKPENKELYEEILSRFKIIDETTQIMDELTTIENNIKEKFFIKGRIEKAIMKLEEYRFCNQKGNFLDDALLNRISNSYLKAYNYIISISQYLSDDHILRLSTLNIDFTNRIQLDINKRRKELGEFENYHELNTFKLNEFIKNYIQFYNVSGRRPVFDSLGDEKELYDKYRLYLSTSNKKQIISMINKFSFKSTIEEIVLTGGIPLKEDIDSYFKYLQNKINNNLPLDAVERKVLMRLKNAVSIENRVLNTYIENNSNIEVRIDNAIKIIEEYKKDYPEDDCSNIYSLSRSADMISSINIIYKYAKKINNDQFEKLLELKIKLPSVIDMTIDERKEYLNGYNSIFEKEQASKIGVMNNYINFVRNNGRRPSFENDKEKSLANEYLESIFKTTINKLKNTAAILKLFDIPLNFYEKALIGEELTEFEIDEYIRKIKERIQNEDLIDKKELKILRAISNYQNYYDKENLDVLIISQKHGIDFYETLSKLKKEKDKVAYIAGNYKFVSKKMIEYALEKKISVSPALIEELNNLDGVRNIYEKEQYEVIKFLSEFKDYIISNKKRPNRDSKLDKMYRIYISKVHDENLKRMFSLLKKNHIELSFEEKVLIKEIDISLAKDYLKTLEKKDKIDILERRVYNILQNNIYLKNEYFISSMTDRENTLASTIYNSLLKRINENPLIDIAELFEITYLNSTYINRLYVCKDNILASRYLPIIKEKMRKLKLPMESALDKQELEVFSYLIKSKYLEAKFFDIINSIKNIDYRNTFYQEEVDYQNFIDRYLKFIMEHDGVRPDERSTSIEEQNLAIEYKKIASILSNHDISLIDNTIEKSIKKSEEESFYDNFISFILENERFPCMNSIFEEELKLANLFISMNKKLDKEQKKYIDLLRKKYMANTMKASMEFQKQNSEIKKK